MATVSFKIYKTPEGKKATIFAVLRVSQAIRPEIDTGERVFTKHWGIDRVKGGPDKVEINLHLNQIEKDLLQMWRENATADKATITKLARIIIRGEASVQKKTVFEAFDRLIAIYKEERDSKTVAKFQTLYNYLSRFDAKSPVTFESMNYGFYDAFKAFLYQQPNQTHPNSFFHDHGDYWTISKKASDYPVGLFDDTVYKHIINLKIFLEWARRREYAVHPSFSDWPIVQREYEPISLTIDELDRLENAIINESHIDVGRDYLVIECRTGQRISDIKRFDIADYADFKWAFKQYKGRGLKRREQKVTVFFNGYCEPALLVLAKHKFQMPAISEQKLNKNIREACKLSGIDQEMYTERWVGNKCVRFYGKKYEFISTHTGRKTFITVGLQYLPPEIVMNLAGISSYQTLKKYKAKSEESVIKDHLNKVKENIAVMRKAN